MLSKTFLAEHVYGLDADPGSNVIELRTPRALVPVPCDMPVVCAAADWLPS